MEPETETEEIAQDKEMVDFRKINIFGESRVGKSKFISWLENYENEEYQIIDPNKRESLPAYNEELNLVEEKVKRVKVPINKKKDLHLLIYETNISSYDNIKNYLDTLLFQTECVLIMWDKSELGTFNNIPNLVQYILDIFKKINTKINIYIVQNKSDLEYPEEEEIEDEETDVEKIEKQIEILKNKYKDSVHEAKISLLNKENINELLLDISKNLDELREKKIMYYIKFKYPLQLIENKNKEDFIHICLVGSGNVGKKTFLQSLLNEEKNGINIIEEKLDQNYLLVQLYYPQAIRLFVKISKTSELNEDLIKKCQGFLVFMDLTIKKGFMPAKDYIEAIKNKGKEKIIILANKIDQTKERKIRKQNCKTFADDVNCQYIECSCLDRINVLEAFRDIVEFSYIEDIIIEDKNKELEEKNMKLKNEVENLNEEKKEKLKIKNKKVILKKDRKKKLIVKEQEEKLMEIEKEKLLENQEKNLEVEKKEEKIDVEKNEDNLNVEKNEENWENKEDNLNSEKKEERRDKNENEKLDENNKLKEKDDEKRCCYFF